MKTPVIVLGGTGYVAGDLLRLIAALNRRDGQAARGAVERDILRGGESILAYLTKDQAGTPD